MGAYLGVVAYPGHYSTQIDQHKEVNIMCLSYCIFITIPIHYSGYYNNWSSLEQMQDQIKTNDHDHEIKTERSLLYWKTILANIGPT